MTHPNEPDLGPLTWVKGEIDAALERAREILEQGEAGSEAAGLQFAQTQCTRCAVRSPSSGSMA